MKTYHFFLILPFVCALSCQKMRTTEADGSIVPTPDTCLVTLLFGGDIMVGYEPLSKADAQSNTFYCFTIDKNRQHYQMGLFDDTSIIQLHLPKGNDYEIRATAIKGYKCDDFFVWYNWFGTQLENGEWISKNGMKFNCKYPFNTEVGIQSTFVNTSKSLSNLLFNYGSLGDGHSILYWVDNKTISTDKNTEWCRFYGTTNITPTVNTTLEIGMKHGGCGIQYQLTGVSDGSVSILVQGPGIKSAYGIDKAILFQEELTEDHVSDNKVIAFTDLTKETETVTVQIIWTRWNGIVQDLGTVDVTLKRNMNNLIRISLSSIDKSTSMNISSESADFLGDSFQSTILE